jgi:hypothetical protein
MARYSRLPNRLVWVALLFIGMGASTVSSELEEFLTELTPLLTNGAASGLSASSIMGVVIGGGLGVLYIWTGYGLLRQWERWRQRAIYLSKFFLGFLAIFGIIFAIGSVSGSWSVSLGGQQIQDPSPLWALGTIAVIGGFGAFFVWALRVLQDEAIRREFFGEAEEVSSSA